MWCHLPRQRLSRFACIACSVAQSCPTFCNPYGLWPARLLCPWDSPGKTTGVDCHFLIQGIFLTHVWMEPKSPALADGFFTAEPPGKPILACNPLQKIWRFCVCVCVCVCVFWSGWGHKRSCMNKKLMQPAMLWVMKSFNCNLGVSGLLPDPWTVADFYMHRISRLFVTLCTEVYSGKCGSSWAKLTTQIQCRGPGREKREESRKCGTKLVHDTSRIKLCQYTLYYSFKWNFTR